MPHLKVRIKRVYEAPHEEDGRRILVDRLWPRGLSRRRAALDDWMKDIAPSEELRKWFGHRPERWEEFRDAYMRELDQQAGRMAELEELARRETITLLFAARNIQQNNAAVIQEYLSQAR